MAGETTNAECGSILTVKELDEPYIRRALAVYEERYGVPSERLVSAFTQGGRLQETGDYRRWRMLYTVAQRAAIVR